LLAGTQLRLADGPSVDAFGQAAPVSSSDLAAEPRWRDFRPLALAAGIRAWLSVPVHQRHGPIGALDFARTDPRPWRPHDLAAVDAYAQLLVTTLRLATAQQEERLSPALRFAVQHDTRIEQARGVIMRRERLDQAAAVELLHLPAQIEGQPIRAVAERLLARPPTLTDTQARPVSPVSPWVAAARFQPQAYSGNWCRTRLCRSPGSVPVPSEVVKRRKPTGDVESCIAWSEHYST
jgi:GAF domain/ANTAR domain